MRNGLYVLLLCFLCTNCSKKKEESAPSLNGTMTVNGVQRTYQIHIPSSINRTSPVSLLFVFHGGGGGGSSSVVPLGFNTLADTEGFIVVYPDAYNDNWNDGRNATCIDQSQDDVAYVNALMDAVSRNYRINTSKIFACGVSNGGIFCHYLASKLSSRIRAIAAVIASIAEPVYPAYSISSPVSAMLINGTDDPAVMYNGGAIFGIPCRGRVVGAEATVNKWISITNCNTTPVVTAIPDRVPGDGCTATEYAYSGGTSGAKVTFIKIQGGGHTWPGTAGGSGTGNVCQDFSATQYVWNFFKSM
jgi:polyhydroxybutyrate depolymerase